MSVADNINNLSEYELKDIKRKLYLLGAEDFQPELELIQTRLNEFEKQNAIKIAEYREQQRIKNEEYERVRKIKEAELEKQKQAWLENPLNDAAKKGWEAMRLSAPNLDGVERFEDLNEALLWRYGAFARAVLDYPLEPVVKSKKQLMREEQELDEYNRGRYTHFDDWDD